MLHYNLQPNEELTPAWIARAASRDAASVDRVLAQFEKRYGGEQQDATCERDSRRIELHGPGGRTMSVWASPPVPTTLGQPAWIPRPDQQLPT